MRRSLVVVSMLSLSLAACGGAGGSRSGIPRVPSSAEGMRAGIAHPTSTNRTLGSLTLWYGTATGIVAAPLAPTGVSATLPTPAGSGVPREITVAPDGTLYALRELNAGAPSDAWQLAVYAPGSNGSANPEQTIAGTGHPEDVVLVGDGIDVLSESVTARATLSTFAYAAGNDPKPIRTLALGSDVSDVAADRADQLYVTHVNGTGAFVYAAAASGNAAPIRKIETPQSDELGIAVAPDGVVYIVASSAGGGGASDAVLAYAGGNNGPAPSRTIASGLIGAGITVDANAQLYYTAYSPSGGRYIFPAYSETEMSSYATGSRNVGTLQLGEANGGTVQPREIISLAVGPGAAPAAQPALSSIYVAYPHRIDAYAIDANGTTAPVRTNTAVNTIGAIAADANGDLYAAEANPPDATLPPTWNAWQYGPNANGSSGSAEFERRRGTVWAAAWNPACFTNTPGAVPAPCLDVADSGSIGTPSGPSSIGIVEPALSAPSAPRSPIIGTGGLVGGLGDDAHGDRYLTGGVGGALVNAYDALGAYTPSLKGTSIYQPTDVTHRLGAVPAGVPLPFTDGLAVGPDGTVYVGVGLGTTAAAGRPMLIAAFAPGIAATSPPSRVILGAFTDPISLAVGNGGELTVLHDNRVDTFAANANGLAYPLRSFPVAAGAIAGPSALAVGP